jgi:putative component of membrane protein insertase Oxa1/YidC/SpoIIIJ protein YidD
MLKEVALIIGTGAGTALNILRLSLSGPIGNQGLTFVPNAKKRKKTATAKSSPTPIFL